MGDPRFDDQVGSDVPDQLLKGHNILRILNDWAPKPRKIVRILGRYRIENEFTCRQVERVIVRVRGNSHPAIVVELISKIVAH